VDKTYTETLKMYDEELRIHVDELNNAKKVYDEKDHERN